MASSAAASSPPQPLISPSVLASDLSNLASEVKRMTDAGCDWVHLDIMSLRKHASEMFFDVHLMVDRPEMWIKPFIDSGGDSITFHWESLSHKAVCRGGKEEDQKTCQGEGREALCQKERVVKLSKMIREQGKKAGLAIKPSTELSQDILDVLDEKAFDMLLIMTVEPGFGGQSFMEDMMDKVEIARKRYPSLHIQ
ncbi:ribulose-phosphate 3-epimerase, partial [Cystoisospora suis]